MGRLGHPKWLEKLVPCHEDSEYVLNFEIWQRESGFYSERTESQTDRITEPSSTVLVYRYIYYNINNKKNQILIIWHEAKFRIYKLLSSYIWLSVTLRKYNSDSFRIERNMIVVIVFFLIINKTVFGLILTCHSL